MKKISILYIKIFGNNSTSLKLFWPILYELFPFWNILSILYWLTKLSTILGSTIWMFLTPLNHFEQYITYHISYISYILYHLSHICCVVFCVSVICLFICELSISRAAHTTKKTNMLPFVTVKYVKYEIKLLGMSLSDWSHITWSHPSSLPSLFS